LERIAGVEKSIVGYSGGVQKDPTYEEILDHTEAILVEFDPAVVSYNEILTAWSKMIANKLGPSSRQYRFAVWYLNDDQKRIAEKVTKEMLEAAAPDYPNADLSSWVSVERVTRFYQAEEYHQHFLTSNASRMKCFF
jgi:methionine-S-sulfoxide reductase